MTIRELLEITPPKTTIHIGIGANCLELDRSEPIELAMYSNYVIGRMIATGENEIEADIKLILAMEE